MRFVLSVAFKYLIPRWRQLSVSIISLVSVLVISLVVWLVVVFLSVTDGIEKNWVKQLVALNAPVRMVPTDAYYRSYYYQIDNLSADSGYSTKTLGEKLIASKSDPYDPLLDAEIPAEFPRPDLRPDGTLKDPVKEGWETISSLKSFPGLRPQEYEVTFGNLRLGLVRRESEGEELTQSYLSQVSYVASLDKDNPHLKKLVLPPTVEDLNNLLTTLSLSTSLGLDEETSSPSLKEETMRQKLASFFENVQISTLKASPEGFRLPRSLFPEQGALKGCGVVQNGRVVKVFIPASVEKLDALKQSFSAFGHAAINGEIRFGEGRPIFVPAEETSFEIPKRLELLLEPGTPFKANFLSQSLSNAALPLLQFEVEASIQDILLHGIVRYEHLEIAEASLQNAGKDTLPLWIYQNKEGQTIIPLNHPLGEGILIAKNYQESGLRLGDTGFLSYYSQAASGVQEQRLPVYVAGFYDPGFMPVGNKLILVDPKVTATLRGNITVADRMLGNGIHIWTPHIEDAPKIKEDLSRALAERGLDKYWTVESFSDYEFARPVLEQLHSDKTLFSLIALIILIVACSNVISMLILLVNDKKREIGILQSMGASSSRIASIFGVCGFFTGFISSLVGTVAAVMTLKNLQSIVNFLSFLQGHQAFHTAFYGDMLPNQVSVPALAFVLLATTFISLLAGIAPAIKAARIRPTEILRSE